MKNIKTINILTIGVIVLSLFTCIMGLLPSYNETNETFTSVHGETVELYGSGIYKNDSVSIVAQGKAQDVITLIIGIPMLIIGLVLSNKNKLKGKLLLTGTLAYFLYSYIYYVFLLMYNELFLVYVMLMSLSLYGFILCMMSFDVKSLPSKFKKEMPVKLIGGFQIFFAAALMLMWLGRIVPPLLNHQIPFGLEHYTTLVIQGMDLGIFVPTAFLSGVLLIKRKPFGYLLSSIIITKGVTMITAISAMIVSQAIAGIEMSIIEILMFSISNLVIIYFMVVLFKNVDDNSSSIIKKAI